MIKKKIKNILKYILTYSTLTIIAAITFFTCLCANTQAETIPTNNPFLNANVKYYATLDSQNEWFEFNLDNNYLQNSTTIVIENMLQNYLDSNTLQEWYQDQGIGYFKIEFDKPYIASELTYYINGTYPWQFDYYFTYYFEDNTQYIYHNEITNETRYWQFKIDLSNTQYGAKQTNAISFRRGASDMIQSISGGEYNIGYNDGYNEGYTKAQGEYQQTITQQQQQIEQLQNNYTNLQNQYNELATNDYTFENLFWSVGSVPMAFLLQAFNVNVLGMNIRAIITGLITALLIIWIIKKLLK